MRSDKITDSIRRWYAGFDQNVETICIRYKVFWKRISMLMIGITPVFFTAKSLNPDTWFLLNSGRYILSHGFTRTEPFSIYPDLKFVFQQWLTDVVFYLVYDSFGAKGLIGLIMAEAILMLGLFYVLCKMVSGGNTSQSLLSTLLFSACSSVFMVTRPQITTYIVLICELIFLEKYVKSGRKNGLYIGLPLLSVYEINSHAAMWGMLFVFLLPYLAEYPVFGIRPLTTQSYAKKPLYLSGGLMLCAALLNPYGIDSMLYVYRAVGAKYVTAIDEMKPAQLTNFGGFLVLIIAGVHIAYYMRTGKSLLLRYFLLYVGCGLLALLNMRSLILFAMVGLAAGAHTFRDIRAIEFRTKWIAIYVLMIAEILSLVAKWEPLEYEAEYERQNFELIGYLDEHNMLKEPKVYTEYNTGAIYEYAGYHCSIDARMEVFIKRMNGVFDYFDEAIEAQVGFIYYKDYLDKYQFDYYVLQKSCNMYLNVSHDSDYVLLQETKDYALYGNADDSILTDTSQEKAACEKQR